MDRTVSANVRWIRVVQIRKTVYQYVKRFAATGYILYSNRTGRSQVRTGPTQCKVNVVQELRLMVSSLLTDLLSWFDQPVYVLKRHFPSTYTIPPKTQLLTTQDTFKIIIQIQPVYTQYVYTICREK
jgi:hypothetical protein